MVTDKKKKEEKLGGQKNFCCQNYMQPGEKPYWEADKIAQDRARKRAQKAAEEFAESCRAGLVIPKPSDPSLIPQPDPKPNDLSLTAPKPKAAAKPSPKPVASAASEVMAKDSSSDGKLGADVDTIKFEKYFDKDTGTVIEYEDLTK